MLTPTERVQLRRQITADTLEIVADEVHAIHTEASVRGASAELRQILLSLYDNLSHRAKDYKDGN